MRMTIRVKRLPEFDLTLNVWTGKLTREDLIAHYNGLTAQEAGRRIAYLDPALDLSSVDVATIPGVTRLVAARLKALYGDKPVTSVVVAAPGSENARLFEAWFRYFAAEGLSDGPVLKPGVKAASDWLGLPHDACEKIRAAIAPLIESPG
jgi:hypothetical protein